MSTTVKLLKELLLDQNKRIRICFFFILMVSCNNSDENYKIEENIYKESIATVLEYDKYYDTDLSISDTMSLCNEFIFAINYLNEVSKFKLEYDYFGIIPKVQNRNVLKNAIYNWERWLYENRSTLTRNRSDSIIKHIKNSDVLIDDKIPLRFKRIMR